SCSDHAQAGVSRSPYVLTRDRRPEARPTRSGIEFRVRGEQCIVTGNTAVENLFVESAEQHSFKNPGRAACSGPLRCWSMHGKNNHQAWSTLTASSAFQFCGSALTFIAR